MTEQRGEARPGGERNLETQSAGRADVVDRALLDWRAAEARVSAYLSSLGLDAAAVRRLCRQALERALGRHTLRGAVSDGMDELPRVLLERYPLEQSEPAARAGESFPRWRLAAWSAGRVPDAGMAEPAPLRATPPLLRGAMSSERFQGRRVGEWRRRGRAAPGAERSDPERAERRRARRPWKWRGRCRRALLGILVVVPSLLAGAGFFATLPAQVWLPAEIALAVFFGALFGWISVGFWTALFGFAVLLRRGGRFAIAPPGAPTRPEGDAPRTAVVMPVCDEAVARVFAGLRATRASLERIAAADAFDFYVLSDSVDPDVCVEEEAAWAEWRRSAEAGAGIYYRRRRVRQKRKSGNVADFCRRFGRRYRYLVVLDADSVMSGEALLRLVGAMEANPHVGIIQTAPRIVRARSLFARLQQFASRLYGPMFAAGMHYWQLGDGPYWGHNAIVRVEPFMRHCGLPRLRGRPPFGGDILSHDFVEAALLGRADWSIWLAFDVAGSYEETPGSLLEEMERDQRWCQGNLQHLRLLFTEGLSSAHRALFLNGVFAYVSAVLWLGFLVMCTTEAVLWVMRGPDYFSAGRTLFPTWPVWRPERMLALFGVVAAVLLLPKVLGVILAQLRGEVAGFGGMGSLLRSVLLETLATALFAPIRMAFYSRFVVLNLLGRSVDWQGSADELRETSWRQALRRHGADTLVACVWALAIRWLHPAAFWWLAPVAGALVLSVPLSVLATRVSLGSRARAAGWLTTPEERQPPREVRDLEAELAGGPPRRFHWRGFVGAVVDPLLNAVHTALLRGPRSLAPGVRQARRDLLERAADAGPGALRDPEKRVVLLDARLLLDLHERVWRLEDSAAASRWGVVGPPPGDAASR